MVGVDPWVAHANRSVYGEDADVFRPERWLEEEHADGDNKMEQYFFTVSSSNVAFVFSNKDVRGGHNNVLLAMLSPIRGSCFTLSGWSLIGAHFRTGLPR